MRIVGEWHTCSDLEVRPVVQADVTDGGGQLRREYFLVDSGADHTVFTAPLLARLNLQPVAVPPGFAVVGVRGRPAFVAVHTPLTFWGDDGSPARIHSDFLAFTNPADADLSILGRDVLNLFHVIISRRLNEVLLLALNHEYRVIVRV